MSRKSDHIELSLRSQTLQGLQDKRFNYEPLLGAHTSIDSINIAKTFVGKNLKFPFWFSSMTGGTQMAKTINLNMAKVCAKLDLGMGLGSVRCLLENDQYLADFDMRKTLGDDRPFYANLGIAQVEQLVATNQLGQIRDLIKKLNVDGLIVHINLLQEWFQPEGDQITVNPIETLKILTDQLDIKIIVKEVGQGMGPKSLQALKELPLSAIELGAFGGTNFSLLESLRHKDDLFNEVNAPLINVGHTAKDMIMDINRIFKVDTSLDVIISGGVKTPLDAWELYSSCHANSVIGLASSVLKFASESEESLLKYMTSFIECFAFAAQVLHVKE